MIEEKNAGRLGVTDGEGWLTEPFICDSREVSRQLNMPVGE